MRSKVEQYHRARIKIAFLIEKINNNRLLLGVYFDVSL